MRPLSTREKEVLQHAAYGHTSKKIGELMGITSGAVNFYSRNIYNKLQCKNRTEAVTWAIANGVIGNENKNG